VVFHCDRLLRGVQGAFLAWRRYASLAHTARRNTHRRLLAGAWMHWRSKQLEERNESELEARGARLSQVRALNIWHARAHRSRGVRVAAEALVLQRDGRALGFSFRSILVGFHSGPNHDANMLRAGVWALWRTTAQAQVGHRNAVAEFQARRCSFLARTFLIRYFYVFSLALMLLSSFSFLTLFEFQARRALRRWAVWAHGRPQSLRAHTRVAALAMARRQLLTRGWQGCRLALSQRVTVQREAAADKLWEQHTCKGVFKGWVMAVRRQYSQEEAVQSMARRHHGRLVRVCMLAWRIYTEGRLARKIATASAARKLLLRTVFRGWRRVAHRRVALVVQQDLLMGRQQRNHLNSTLAIWRSVLHRVLTLRALEQRQAVKAWFLQWRVHAAQRRTQRRQLGLALRMRSLTLAAWCLNAWRVRIMERRSKRETEKARSVLMRQAIGQLRLNAQEGQRQRKARIILSERTRRHMRSLFVRWQRLARNVVVVQRLKGSRESRSVVMAFGDWRAYVARRRQLTETAQLCTERRLISDRAAALCAWRGLTVAHRFVTLL
jgi:hypothetical protein